MGNFHYFDLNSINGSGFTPPVLSKGISKLRICDMEQAPTHSTHNLCSLSSGLGGVSLFSIKDASVCMQMKEVETIKTKFFPENPNFLGLITC
jgi:hypothetical protein